MKLSFVVSAFNRPDALRLCLTALILQSFTDFEAIVMDNAVDPAIQEQHRNHCEMDGRIRYFPSYETEWSKISCYYSGDYGAQHLAQGEWVGFPSDDSYYTRTYASKLLRLAERDNLELVYCDVVMERSEESGLLSHVMNTEARVCMIDKTNFLLKRSRFIPFPAKYADGSGSCSDGELINELVRQGIRHEKVAQPLCVHS